jgi:hypothetical protein
LTLFGETVITNELPSRPCPLCGAVLHPYALTDGEDQPRPAVLFTDCLRRCDNCRVGLSNARTVGSETTIYGDASDNVPTEVRDGFVQALRCSINVLNRPNKLIKAGYSTSEDALTWTMFRYLESKNRLRETFAANGVAIAQHASVEPRLILWGAEVPGRDGSASQVPAGLHRVSCLLQETTDRRTEPDVILDFGVAGIVFVEVKFRSGNEIKPSKYAHWERYLGDQEAPFKNPAEVRSNGHYELTRNWRIAWELSRMLNVPIALINLGKDALFDGAKGRALSVYESLLAQDGAHAFYRLSWRRFLDAAGYIPPWLRAYLTDRTLAQKTAAV